MASTFIFDLDGVLIDSESLSARASQQAIAELYGMEIPLEDFHAFIGQGIHEYVEGPMRKHNLNIPDSDVLIQRRLAILEEMMRTELSVFPGVLSLLEKLHETGKKLAIASSSQHEKVMRALDAVGINPEWFSTIMSGDDVAHPKPDPTIYVKTLEKLESDASQGIVFEDSLAGVQAAKAAGLLCFAVSNSFPAEKLMEAGADAVFSSFEDLTLSDLEQA